MGIEPTFSAWEADVLPLNYAREMKCLTPPLYKLCRRVSRFCPGSRPRDPSDGAPPPRVNAPVKNHATVD